jgi:6-phosphogluconolactonase
MRILSSVLGEVRIAPTRDLFQYAWESIQDVAEHASGSAGCVALTGGSTPKAFYEWVVQSVGGVAPAWLSNLTWTTSDERWVPLDSSESNQGNAQRQLLEPLGVGTEQRLFWDVTQNDPEQAAVLQEERMRARNSQVLYDLCFLGMGDDGHTASLFPGSPLLSGNRDGRWLHSVEVPGKGMRLTITPEGFHACRRIMIMVCGAGKVERMREVMQGTDRVIDLPVRLLAQFADKTTWLVDPAAGAAI